MKNTAAYTNSSYCQDFVLVFEVTDSNPNGDLDAGNLPRVDFETIQGLVTDVCLECKVRDNDKRCRQCSLKSSRLPAVVADVRHIDRPLTSALYRLKENECELDKM